MVKSPVYPLRPSFPARPSGDAIAKACLASLAGYVTKTEPLDMARTRWGANADVEVILRAATTPTTTATAAAVTTAEMPDALTTLAPQSAAAVIIDKSMKLSFGRGNNVIVPNMLAAPGNVAWVAQGSAIAVAQLSTAGTISLGPSKLAVIVVFTRELIESSNALAVVKSALAESVGPAIGSAMLDATAAGTTRPAGLRNTIATSTASVLTPLSEALLADVATLVAAIAPVLGNDRPLLVAAPAQAARLKLVFGANPQAPLVVASSQLANGIVVAMAPQAIVTVSGGPPVFSQVDQATVHFEGATPGDITTATVATTIKSLWQSDQIGCRLIMDLSFARRHASALSWTTVTW